MKSEEEEEEEEEECDELSQILFLGLLSSTALGSLSYPIQSEVTSFCLDFQC